MKQFSELSYEQQQRVDEILDKLNDPKTTTAQKQSLGQQYNQIMGVTSQDLSKMGGKWHQKALEEQAHRRKAPVVKHPK